MMNLLIALAAGCASALMFASIISGALISLLLFYLAPLPLMVAALGWGPASALIGGIVAGAGLGFAFGLPYFGAFVLTVGLPAFWLGHLALLAKPVEAPASAADASQPVLEWYPLGRLLLWICAFSCLITISALFTLGSDYESITTALRNGLARIVSARDGTPPNTDTDRVMELIAQIAPSAATSVAMFTLTLNLWLAGKIVSTSGRLRRPWPNVGGIELPQVAMVVLAVALVLSFTDGLLAMLSQIASAALLMAYLLVGFAVLHVITLATGGRMWWLMAAYLSVAVLGWPALLVVMLGLIDGVIGLRQRFANRTGPPTLST